MLSLYLYVIKAFKGGQEGKVCIGGIEGTVFKYGQEGIRRARLFRRAKGAVFKEGKEGQAYTEELEGKAYIGGWRARFSKEGGRSGGQTKCPSMLQIPHISISLLTIYKAYFVFYFSSILYHFILYDS